MDRLACVDVPALPLQLLLRAHEDWRAFPVAVVEEEKPLAFIAWVNERAYRLSILPGMRYAAGLSISGDLRAGVVSESEIAQAVSQVTESLREFTPHIEPSMDEPGVFWLDASGLSGLFPSLQTWGEQIRAKLASEKLRASVVIGFSRFGTYALAKSRRTVTLLETPESERTAASRVPLRRLRFNPETREALHKLGIETVGQFLELPASGLLQRFGPEAKRLHDLASGSAWNPLQPKPAVAPLTGRMELGFPETDVMRLVFCVKRLLHPLIEGLVEREQALWELALTLHFEDAAPKIERLRPAEPTLEVTQLLNLVHLRFEAIQLPGGVVELALEATGVPASREQLRLHASRPRRDLAAATRALARIRAEFGEDVVVRPVLKAGHLPEASFAWEPLQTLTRVDVAAPYSPVLVLRVLEKPLPLPLRERREPEGWLLHDWRMGPVTKLDGPYEVSGGWWGGGVQRAYHFAETQRGDQLWLYYDVRRRRWFLHGVVE